MNIARQSTARTFIIGPVLAADGSAVTDCVVADFKVSKNGAAPAALDGSTTLTHRHTGHYSLAAAAGDYDTVGGAQFTIDDTVNGCQPKDFTVIEEAVFDIFFAAGATGAVPVASLGANVITAAATAADFSTEVNAAVVALIGTPVVSLAADIAALPGAGPSSDENAVAVLEKLLADHSAVAGSLAERLTRIPNVAPAANGGLPTVNGSNQIAGIAGTIATLDALDTAQDTQHTTTQGRLPAALVGGRIDASVGAMAAGVVTAAAVATDAIDADAIAASAVTEIQNGLATAVGVSAVETDTQDIQARLPAALIGGRMNSSVEAINGVEVVGDGDATPWGPV